MDIWGPNTETLFTRADSDCEGVNAAKGVHDVGKRSVAHAFARATHVTTDGHWTSDIGQLLWLITSGSLDLKDRNLGTCSNRVLVKVAYGLFRKRLEIAT